MKNKVIEKMESRMFVFKKRGIKIVKDIISVLLISITFF